MNKEEMLKQIEQELKHDLYQELSKKELYDHFQKEIEALKAELAEIKEKAIMPRFKIGQRVFTTTEISLDDACMVEEIIYCPRYRDKFFYRLEGYYTRTSEALLFATRAEAEASLRKGE